MYHIKEGVLNMWGVVALGSLFPQSLKLHGRKIHSSLLLTNLYYNLLFTYLITFNTTLELSGLSDLQALLKIFLFTLLFDSRLKSTSEIISCLISIKIWLVYFI